jgi:DNA-binding transcriptional LysR family regulator
MDFRLHVFRTVAECRNITQAARKLHLSQPAVTKHIQRIEEDLQVPLFLRSASGMILTPAGVVYLEHAQQVAAANEDVLRRLQAPTGILKGRLRLGSNKTVLAYYLPEILALYKKRYPEVLIEIMDGNTDTIVGAMLDQRLDLALIEGPCRRPELQKKHFLEDEIIWIASPSDPLCQLRKPTPQQVLSRPLILREVGAGSRQFMELTLRRLRIPLDRLNVIQEIPSPEAIKRLVIAGLGIGCLFRLGAEQDMASGKLVKIDCPALSTRQSFTLLLPHGPAPSGIVEAFAQLLLERGG